MEQDPQFIHGNHAEIEEQIMENYMDALAAAQLLVSSPQPLTQPRAVNNENITQTTSNNVDYSLTKIPRVELRKFDGSIDQWRAFSDWFIGTIHNREGITDSMKLSYLHDSLIDEAAKTIAGFENTNENYQEAWNLLKLTYNNERVIIFNHFELFMAIPNMRNNSADAIRQLINEAQVQVRKMKVMGQLTDKWDVPLVYIVTSKLDKNTKHEWNRKITGNKIPTFEELITFLRDEANRMQTTEVTPSYANKEQKPINKSRRVLTTIIYKNCLICQEDGHATYRCTKLNSLSVPERIEAVKKANLCFNCLRQNHHTNECNKGDCFKCGKRHHTMLHLEKTVNKNTTNTAKNA